MIKAIYWVPLLEAVLLLGLCIYLVRIYGDMKRTGWFTLLLVVLGWYMAFSMIFAIPLDIYIVSANSFLFAAIHSDTFTQASIELGMQN